MCFVELVLSGRLRPDTIIQYYLISVMMWMASARYYNSIPLIRVMVWTASARYNLLLFFISIYYF